MLWVAVAASASAQEEERQDTINRSVVTASLRQILSRKSAYSTEVLQEKFLQRHFSGNVVQAMENLPGIQSMDIGSGFSKPMIRGMGFSRIAVSEGGIKQEGQQWGADHGLEIDAYSVTGIQVLKGPASLLYGSDAIGGVIEILPPEQPVTDGPYAEVKTLAKSVNDLLGGSVMVGYANDRWMLQTRYTEQHYGDYRVPADTIVYLTRRIPLYGRKMKNTAGYERDASLYASCRAGHYRGSYTLSNAFQKAGFFPGAHGIPDLKRLQDDGDSRNIDLPMSRVNHLKAATTQSFTAG
ncbi:MAG: TonB-dependent receptor plug domain-containing protein, partial [Bacteroidales bacterium]|nr:TonB-dependent receptor plug domain-containing protein [Bacteroidales bacterium]